MHPFDRLFACVNAINVKYSPYQLRRIAARTAFTMFCLAISFLICLAILVVIWVDVPVLENLETVGSPINEPSNPTDQALLQGQSDWSVQLESVTLFAMAIFWPVFLIEAGFHFLTRPWKATTLRFHFASLCTCFFPPLRMGARALEMRSRIWFPRLGWRKVDDRLRRQLERAFSLPMIVIATLILPALILEFRFRHQVDNHLWLRILLHGGTGMIWFAFTAEFILMVSVARRKRDYIRAHWIDLAIICLPLISFLRSLRAIRSLRLARLARVQQLAQISRAYRLRGIVLKLFRALILFEVFHRIFRSDARQRLDRLNRELAEKESEVAALRFEIAKTEQMLEQQDSQGEPLGTKA